MASLPRLPNGKVNLRALAKMADDMRLTAAAATAAPDIESAVTKYGSLEAFLKRDELSALQEAGVDSMGMARLFTQTFEGERAVFDNLPALASTFIVLWHMYYVDHDLKDANFLFDESGRTPWFAAW